MNIYYSKNNGIASHLTRYNAVILKSSHFSLKVDLAGIEPASKNLSHVLLLS